MKKTIFGLLIPILFSSCTKKYEYLVVEDRGEYTSEISSNRYKSIDVDSILKANGNKGYELVSVVPLTETSHPNFGNSQYVTGLQPNVRTGSILYYFKRIK